MRKIFYAFAFLFLLFAFAAPAEADSSSTYAARLNASDFVFNGESYAGKKACLVSLAEHLLSSGFEPAFVAGVLGNAACEGSYGLFENITGYTLTRFQQVFSSTMPCAVSGRSHTNYIAHMKGFPDYDLCGHDHSEYALYNNQYIYSGFSLSAISDMLDRYAAENWLARFGLGSLQWSAERTAVLFGFYRKEAGGSDTISYSQCAEAEMNMISYELLHEYYTVYKNWQLANNTLNTPEAAYNAGYCVCIRYERPADMYERAITRGNIARDIFAAMNTPVGDTAAPTVTVLSLARAADIGYDITVRAEDPSGISDFRIRSWNVKAGIGACRWQSLSDGEIISSTDTAMTVKFRITAADFGGVVNTVYCSAIYAADKLGNMTPDHDIRQVSCLIPVPVGLTVLQLPAALTEIGPAAFEGTAAQLIIIPESCVTIAEDAFANCSALKYIMNYSDAVITPPEGVMILSE